MEIEFEVYKRIVNGDLRPHLPRFSNNKGLRELRNEFFTIKFDEDNPINDIDKFMDSVKAKASLKDGDRVSFHIGKNIITMKKIPLKDEEEFINIDLGIPPDKKAALFLEIIENEYGRFKLSLNNTIYKYELVKLQEYFNVNEQIAKNIAHDAHLLSKQIKLTNRKYDLDDPNYYIIFVVKKFLVYSIIDLQNKLGSLVKIKTQLEGELEDELFDMDYTIRMNRANALSEKINKMHISRLYNNLGIDASLKEKIEYFKQLYLNKCEDINTKRLSGEPILYADTDGLELYLNEFTKLLYEYYTEKLNSDLTSFATDARENLEKIFEIINYLHSPKASVEYNALKNTDFFDRLDYKKNNLIEYLKLNDTVNGERSLLNVLFSILLILQTRKHNYSNENQMNDSVTDFLRVSGQYISDQTRSGRSGSELRLNFDSGELDIAIRSFSNGVIISIIEAFILNSCGPKCDIVKNHVDKLLNKYDTNGNIVNYVIIYAKASDFDKLWENYKRYILCEFKMTIIEDSHKLPSKANFKYGENVIVRNGIDTKLIHLFLDMH